MEKSRKNAEEFFNIVVQNRRKMIDIPLAFSQGEPGTLLYLSFGKNGSTVSELSNALNVSMPRVMSVINSLEEKGFIIKENDKNDKRKTVIFITEKGKNIVEEKKEEAINNIEKIIKKLDDKDIDDYMRIARKINLTMKNLKEKEE